MRMTPSLFSTPAITEEAELNEDLLEIRKRLLSIVTSSHDKEQMTAVIKKIFDDGLFIELADFAEHCLKHDSKLNHLCYALITHPFLDDFWEHYVLKTKLGLAKIAAIAIPPLFVHQDDWAFNHESALYKTKSEYLFNLLVGILRASQAKIGAIMRDIVFESLSVLESSTEAALRKLHPADNEMTQDSFKLFYKLNRPSYNASYRRTLLLYLYLEIKTILEAKAAGEKETFIETLDFSDEIMSRETLADNPSLTPMAMEIYTPPPKGAHKTKKTPLREEALFTLRALKREGPIGYSYFAALGSALYEELEYPGGYSKFITHASSEYIRDADIDDPGTKGSSLLFMAFRFYRESNDTLAKIYLDYIVSGEDALNLGLIKALKRTLGLMQLDSLNDQDALDIVERAVGHLVNRLTEAESTRPKFVLNSKLNTLLLIYYLHQKRASYHQKFRDKYEKILRGTHPHKTPESLMGEISNENVQSWLKHTLNKKHAEECTEKYLALAEQQAKTTDEKQLITHFKNISAAPNPCPSLFETYQYYYVAYSNTQLEHPIFKKASCYLAILENSSVTASFEKAACQLASNLIYLNMLDSRFSKDVEIHINRQPPESRKRIYQSITKQLEVIYTSGLLDKGHCISRLIAQIYAEKIQDPAQAATWLERAAHDQIEAERKFDELGIKTEHRKIADPKQKCSFAELISSAQILGLRFYTRFIFSKAAASITSQLRGLNEDMETAATEYYAKGIAVGSFYCLDRTVKRILARLKTIKPDNEADFQKIVVELLQLGDRAIKYHGAIGHLLLAEIHMQIAEHLYKYYSEIEPPTTLATASLFADGPRAPNPYFSLAMQHRSEAVRHYIFAEALYPEEPKARIMNALHGKSDLSLASGKTTDRKSRYARFAKSAIPLDSESAHALEYLNSLWASSSSFSTRPGGGARALM